MLQPSSTKRLASQSSNAGCVGLEPIFPKLLAFPAKPRPKWCCQIRFAITRAVSGLRESAIHFASAERRPEIVSGSIGARNPLYRSIALSTPGVTRSPGDSRLPPMSTCIATFS